MSKVHSGVYWYIFVVLQNTNDSKGSLKTFFTTFIYNVLLHDKKKMRVIVCTGILVDTVFSSTFRRALLHRTIWNNSKILHTPPLNRTLSLVLPPQACHGHLMNMIEHTLASVATALNHATNYPNLSGHIYQHC